MGETLSVEAPGAFGAGRASFSQETPPSPTPPHAQKGARAERLQTHAFAPFRLPGAAYERVFAEGRSLACGSMVMRWVPNGLAISRLGVVSAKRTFRLAVERSRARRLMREAFRLERPGMAPGMDLILVGRRKVLDEGCAEVRRERRWVCRKAGLQAGERSGCKR